MVIALLNENSQADKNEVIYNALKKVCDKNGDIVINFGMYSSQDENSITYVQVGILTAILLNSKAVDFVVTGCGTGEGAMLACNAFPNVLCGHITDAMDAYMFSQINAGNAVALPFAKGFGWGAELNLENIFENLFKEAPGQGYPKERAIPEKKNKEILDKVKEVTHSDFSYILKNLDKELLKGAISLPNFKDYIYNNSKVEEISNMLKQL